MRIVISWTTHSRQYSVGVVPFLKQMGIEVTDEQLVATAKKLLEQKELDEDNPDH